MSKCREAFEQHCKERVINPDGDYATDLYFDWQAAWNAATKNVVKICEGQMTGVNPVGDMAREECAEEIEREKA